MKKNVMCALLVSACGTWSNEDLEFLYALPDKATLHSVAPGESAAMQGLSRQGLSVGEPSETYANTKATTHQFNGYLDQILDGLDAIRRIPPTTRTTDSRIWGPYESPYPGFQVEVQIDRQDGGEYDWTLRYRQAGQASFDIGAGHFTPTVTLKQGQGGFFIDGKSSRDHFDAGSPTDPDTMAVTYVTDRDPKHVDMAFVKDQIPALGYAYSENDAGQVHADFTVTGTDPGITKLQYRVAWDLSGEGRTDVKVLEGTYADAGFLECWDTAQKVVYSDEIFDGGPPVGLKGACVVIPDF